MTFGRDLISIINYLHTMKSFTAAALSASVTLAAKNSNGRAMIGTNIGGW